MNISGFMKKFGKTLSNTAGNAADAIGTGLGTLDGSIGKTVSEKASKKIFSKASNIIDGNFPEFPEVSVRARIAEKFANEDNAIRLGNAIGAGTEGLLVGSAGGAVIGGIAGGVNEDETFIGGAVKGALVGGALGGIGGGIGGAIHNNAGLMENISNDAISISNRISKWAVGIKDSMSIKKDGMATLVGDLQ